MRWEEEATVVKEVLSNNRAVQFDMSHAMRVLKYVRAQWDMHCSCCRYMLMQCNCTDCCSAMVADVFACCAQVDEVIGGTTGGSAKGIRDIEQELKHSQLSDIQIVPATRLFSFAAEEHLKKSPVTKQSTAYNKLSRGQWHKEPEEMAGTEQRGLSLADSQTMAGAETTDGGYPRLDTSRLNEQELATAPGNNM